MNAAARSAGARLARIAGLVVAAILLWLAVLIAFVGLSQNEIVVGGDDAASLLAAARAHGSEHRGNLALVVIEDGHVQGEHAVSIGRTVDSDTLFQMASVSKWVTAWGVMTLVEAGKIDLDAPVSLYLRRWRLSSTAHNNDLVTVRRLLSHTAGLTDGLGYCGFAPGDGLQPLPASLTSAADACPFIDGAVRMGERPGTWRYSGGGYSLLQLMIEDVSG